MRKPNSIKRKIELAHAISRDAGNRAMKKAGRTKWSEEDLNAATSAFHNFYSEGTRNGNK